MIQGLIMTALPWRSSWPPKYNTAAVLFFPVDQSRTIIRFQVPRSTKTGNLTQFTWKKELGTNLNQGITVRKVAIQLYCLRLSYHLVEWMDRDEGYYYNRLSTIQFDHDYDNPHRLMTPQKNHPHNLNSPYSLVSIVSRQVGRSAGLKLSGTLHQNSWYHKLKTCQINFKNLTSLRHCFLQIPKLKWNVSLKGWSADMTVTTAQRSNHMIFCLGTGTRTIWMIHRSWKNFGPWATCSVRHHEEYITRLHIIRVVERFWLATLSTEYWATEQNLQRISDWNQISIRRYFDWFIYLHK